MCTRCWVVGARTTDHHTRIKTMDSIVGVDVVIEMLLKIAKGHCTLFNNEEERSYNKIIDHYEKDTPEYRSGGAYRAMLKLFADNIKNENNT